MEDRDTFIKQHIPFIIKSISETTGRYVSIENDEELSIGILAFNEAIEKHDEERGSFLSFAKLVISSRIKNYIKANKSNEVSLDLMTEAGFDIGDDYKDPIEEDTELTVEIEDLKKNIEKFGFSFEDLVKEAPKHKDTRENAIEISKNSSKEETITNFMFSKYRLPIKKISLRFTVSEKILKRSKKFIISVIIIFFKNFRNLKLWIRE